MDALDIVTFLYLWGWGALPWELRCKEFACNAGDPGSIPGSGRFPWRMKWLPTPVFLPGESHGQRNLVGYRPWGFKESDTTEHFHFHTFFFFFK